MLHIITTTATASDTTPTIAGSAEAGSTVEVFSSRSSNSLGTTTADGGGSFSFTPSSSIGEGNHYITAKATVLQVIHLLLLLLLITGDTTAPTIRRVSVLQDMTDELLKLGETINIKVDFYEMSLSTLRWNANFRIRNGING